MGKKTYFVEQEKVEYYECSTCSGKGKVWVKNIPIHSSGKEPFCIGYEEINDYRECHYCHGSGRVSKITKFFQASNEEAERRHKK